VVVVSFMVAGPFSSVWSSFSKTGPPQGCLAEIASELDTGQVTRLKRAIELLFICVVFPIAALWVVGIAIAASPTGFFAYLGALLAAWLLCTFVFPLAAGVMTPDEIVAGIRLQRRHETHFEGEPLPESRLFGSPLWFDQSDDAPKLGPRPSHQPSRSFE
jgi:hypothetical protein